jgi:hypothetical protein
VEVTTVSNGRATEVSTANGGLAAVRGASAGAVVLAAGALALAATAADVAVTVLANRPFDPIVATPGVRAATGTVAPLAAVLGLGIVAATARVATARVGLLFAAAFGGLAVAAPGATLPGVVALALGAALALSGTLGRPAAWGPRAVGRHLVAAGFVAGIAVSLWSAVGLLDPGLGGAGELLALGAVVGAGVLVRPGLLGFAAGLVAAGAVVAASVAAPFVVGSALLVAFAVGSAPQALVAAAVGAAIAAAVAGLARGEQAPAVGAGLLVLAGIPVTPARALVVALGATLLVLDVTADGVGRPTEVAGS